ncbi:hypothetical protein TRFO_04181 [Tritrichomonas foetus]|uniref:Zinc finger RING-type eukaryotic domain-containing protein n=1 Tax=Tritrichomonas foetus TaxID=1144522 RepID=A0A1J4KI04_9EUKA|nr:hypothetical protein TRFO_04181 [Tritrichomonas foetus]|eukprot:OHT10674.1 hypothetical protein TRFO_04181 [Tritrichomonas foetus]
MLRLYLRALSANTQESIVEVAEDTQDYMMHNFNSMPKLFSFDTTFLATLIESESIIQQVRSPKKSLAASDVIFCFVLVPTCIFSVNPPDESRFRLMTSTVLQTIPWPTYISQAISRRYNLSFTIFNRNVNLQNSVLIGVASLYQAFIGRNTGAKTKRPIVSFLSKSFQIFVINQLAFCLSQFLLKKLSFIPPSIIEEVVPSFIAAPLTHLVLTVGVENLFSSLVLSILRANKNPPRCDYEIPPEEPVPQALKCIICYDIFTDPVTCRGHTFCRGCLRRWLHRTRGHARHPITGEMIKESDIKSNIVFDLLVSNYRLCLQNKNRNRA